MNKFIIFSHGRSGSTRLNLLLNQHPDITCCGEIFHRNPLQPDVAANQVFSQHKELTLKNLNDCLIRRSEFEKTKAIGFKLLDYRYNALNHEQSGVLLNDNTYKAIIIERKNKLKGFISWKTAKLSGKWHIFKSQSGQEVSKINPYTIDIKEAKEWIEISENFIAHTERILNSREDGFIKVYYEDFLHSWDKTQSICNDIFKFIEVDNFYKFEEPTIKSSANNIYDSIINKKELESAFSCSLSYP